MADQTFKTPSRPPKRPHSTKELLVKEKSVSPMTIPPSPMMKRLGCGTGVVVYRLDRGSFSSPCSAMKSPWAVKKAKKSRNEAMARLKIESEILKKLDHPNIVSYRKFSTLENGDACLSMEQGGTSLDTMIEKYQEEGKEFTAFEVASVAMSIAKALSYLHNKKKLLHGDLKSGNVLVSADFRKVKLCDFGVALYLRDDLSGPLDPKGTYTGTMPWSSKEVLDDGPITDKADIFSYGLLIWEMLALDVPHVNLIRGDDDDADSSYASTEQSFDEDEDAYMVALGTRPPLPNKEFDPSFMAIIGVFACCTEADYKKRPSAEQVVKAFEPTANALKVVTSE
eukprot:Seg422.3 transcript_id=Seg422.3/GoldUCD/mRNA.D3Y31 product="Lymphokine-activated killer T-cell-originated protein kinase" protein_id=Seg422.3/GoldUCD/D3Y31